MQAKEQIVLVDNVELISMDVMNYATYADRLKQILEKIESSRLESQSNSQTDSEFLKKRLGE